MKCILFFLFLMWLSSCNSTRSPYENERYGGNLQIEIPYPPSTFFPPFVDDEVSESVIYQMHIGLVRFNSVNATIQPGIARSWDIDNTGKVYVFYLDSTVFFHDDDCFVGGKGRRVTAHDFKYTFEYLASQRAENKNFGIVSRIKGAKEYYSHFQKNLTSEIEGIQIIDDFTIKIELESPAAVFLFHLAKPAASVIAQEAVSRYGLNCLVGAGPFLCKGVNNDGVWILEKNWNFFKKDNQNFYLPYLDSVTFRHVRSKQERSEYFLKNELDAMLYINSEFVSEITESFDADFEYVLKESFQTSDSKRKLYNIISNDVQNLYTNNLRLLDLSEVYKNKVLQ